MDVLIMLACVVVTASLLSNLFRYLAQRIIENMRVRTLCRLRDRVYEHVLSMNLGFFSNERKGDIMARITSDVQVVQFCITNTLQVVFRDPFLILFYVVAMLAISVQLSLFSVIYLPVVALLIGTIVKRLRRSAKEVQESFGELTSVLDESLSGMKVIKGYNAETFFGRRFNDINRKFSDISRRIAYRQQLASPMSEFLGIAAAAGLLIFGGILVTGGKLDCGRFPYLPRHIHPDNPPHALLHGCLRHHQSGHRRRRPRPASARHGDLRPERARRRTARPLPRTH